MCFNAKTSLFTFVIGAIGSILLIIYGNKKYKINNNIFGIFLFFIALIQLMDFLFWIDIKNKLGINKIVTLIGPLLNVGQPLILYAIKLIYYKPNICEFNNFNLPVATLNFSYFIYLFSVYYKFISTEKILITSTKNGHLSWPWLKYYNPIFYLILFAINIFYLTNFNYSLLLFVIVYSFLLLSMKYFYYSAGELWCFFGAFIPLIMFIFSYYI
jgi:hypothetical protein